MSKSKREHTAQYIRTTQSKPYQPFSVELSKAIQSLVKSADSKRIR